MKEILIKWVV